MSNYISGKNLLTRLDILPFELFDYVKKGLQPFDKFGKPIPPPDIKFKINQLEESEEALEEFLRCCWPVLPKSAGEVKELFEKKPSYVAYADEQIRLAPLREYLLNKIETLKNEIEQNENKYSWSNYELPEDQKSAQWVIDLLLNSYFLNELVNAEKNESIKIAESKLQSIRGEKGGKKPKKNQPILRAITQYLREHSTIEGKTNYQIAESFKRHVGNNEPIIVNFNECEWEVYFADNYIEAVADTTNKKKHKDKSIAYSTFRNSYISEAKKIIKKS